MKVLYFSWIKDKLGKSHEEIKVSDENYLDVFKDTSSIKVSINMETATFEDSIHDNDEVAFFPPMTGG